MKKNFLFLSDDEIDDFDNTDNLKPNIRNNNKNDDDDDFFSTTQRKTQPSPLTIVKDKDRLVTDQKQQKPSSPTKVKNSQTSNIQSSSPSPPRLTKPQSPESKPVNNSNSNKSSSSSPNEKIKNLLSNSSLFISSTNNSIENHTSNSSNNNNNDGDGSGDKSDNFLNKKQGQVGISLSDLIDNHDREQVINDLPGFSPEHQKKAIESIEKKNSRSDDSSSKPKTVKPKKVTKSLRSVFDDLKYSPTTSGCNALSTSSQSLSQSRNRSRPSTTPNNDDSSMKKLEDLFQNVGSNMKRKFQVVKLYSIITMRKKREETCDLSLKNLFHSNKMKIVGFIGTKTVIFTAPESAEKEPRTTNQIKTEPNEDEEDEEVGDGVDGIHVVTHQKEENMTIYVFNLFSLMKDLLKHKFLELFSNLPTFNVELEIDEITNPVQTNQHKNSPKKDHQMSIEERFQKVMNDQKPHNFFDDDEMKKAAKDCFEEKKAMFLDYFSIFYKDGMIKTMPDVIRGYRPSFSSFPLFLEKLVTEVDWEDEMSCLDCLIDQLAQLYSILPNEGNEENQKIANNLILQFKTSVLPELSDESYLPNSSLRDNGSFVSFPMPPNNF